MVIDSKCPMNQAKGVDNPRYRHGQPAGAQHMDHGSDHYINPAGI